MAEQWGSDQAAHQHACQGVANQVIGICAQNNNKWVGKPDSALSAKARKQRVDWEAQCLFFFEQIIFILNIT